MKVQFVAAAALLALAALPAQAVGRLADVTVIDRATGSTLPTYYHRGEHWVAGVPGAKYSIMVRNRLSGRLLAVTAVDGVNVLTGDTAGWEQSGYVFSPRQSYQVTGWRKSDAEVAAFEFSDASNSYAQRTGRPAHLGVIGVALFREKQPEPPPYIEQRSARDQPAAAQLPASPAPLAKAEAGESASSLGAAQSRSADAQLGRRFAESAPAKLGTAHGQREASYVSGTSFERLSAQPDEVIRIRYDSRDNLLAMGVIVPPRTLPQPGPNPFPESPLVRYVPDPPIWR
jgi:hypothetical protein